MSKHELAKRYYAFIVCADHKTVEIPDKVYATLMLMSRVHLAEPLVILDIQTTKKTVNQIAKRYLISRTAVNRRLKRCLLE